jgi:hypothetical protein
VDWYSSPKGEVIGQLLLDRVEKTWLGDIWVRDHTGGYGDGNHAFSPYKILIESEARQLLVAKMQEVAVAPGKLNYYK